MRNQTHLSILIGLSAAVFSSLAGAVNAAPSRVNPGNFPVEKVPQFVCIGADDNYHPDGFKFFVDSLKAKVNKSQATPQAGTFDGTPVRMSFYLNTDNGGDPNSNNITSTTDAEMKRLAGYVKQALADGQEIGDHTRTHTTSTTTTLSVWTSEINNVLTDLNKIGLNPDTVVGFRTPYLYYNDNTFNALASIKQFRYDCSIQSGWDKISDGTNYVWPYTLDNGPFAPDTATNPVVTNTTNKVVIGHHPGLWEAPVYALIVPPELRHKVWSGRVQTVAGTTYTADFDTTNGKAVGMDYNVLSGPSNYGGLGFDSATYVAVLKHSLDLRLAGNRAPFLFTVHSNIFYDTLGWAEEGNTTYNGPGAKSPKTTPHQARGAIMAFLNYALSKPEVRIVTQRELVKWCENPVPFASAIGTGMGRSINGSGISIHVDTGKIFFQGLPANTTVSLTLTTPAGKELARATAVGSKFNWKTEKLAPGSYIIRVNAPGLEFSRRISL